MRTLPPGCVYLVTDRRRLSPDARTTLDEVLALEHFLDEALAAEVDVIQVRERDMDGRAIAAFVRRLHRRAAATATQILVNDRADVALAAGADGVHVRSDGPVLARLRALDPGWLIGRSVHVGEDRVLSAGAGYTLFGSVFATDSKPGGPPPVGLGALGWAVASSVVPVVAIGGIDAGGAEACARAGAAGVAAIGLFLPEGTVPGALGVRHAVPALRAALRRGRAG